METCPHCRKTFKKITSRHKAVCDGWEKPPSPSPCLCGHESTSLTQMKRHRRDCDVWQNRDKAAVAEARRRETSVARYGVEDARRSPEADAKRAATNKARYGAENPFCKEASTFDKVQEALEGKRPVLRGEDNPFAKPEVQEKIRATMVERYGSENPQQVSEIRERTRQTNLERYGSEEVLSVPEIRARIRATCEEVYGGPAPSCDPDVLAKQRETNEERYGVPWTGMDPEVRAKQMQTHLERYGSHWFASEQGKKAVREAMREKYGVEFPGELEGHWEKVLETFHSNYPGVAWPGMLARSSKGPNGLEQKVWDLAPEGTLEFTGDGSWWRWLPKLDHYKNPDFIMRGEDRKVVKVVEAFGDFWHSRMFTGKAPFDHEQELIDAYAEIGIECLVVWESEVKEDPNVVQIRLRDHLVF